MTRTRITLYGGVNEIGGNKFLVEEGPDRIFLDFGMSIGARGNFYEEFLKPRTNSALRDLLRLRLLPHVDGIYRHDFLTVARGLTDKDLPESASEHIMREGRPPVAGILLTHAHVDHFQDLSFVDPRIPVHCTATTAAMLRAISDVSRTSIEGEIWETRARSVGSTSDRSTFPGIPSIVTGTPEPRAIHAFEDGATFDLGAFRVTPIPVDHSVPGGCAFLVRAPSGRRIFYTGDIRLHGSLAERTKALLAAAEAMRPDVMLCEGTRISHEQVDDEAGVERGLDQLVADASGLVVTEFAWKDTTRFETVQRVAERHGRTLLVNPKLAHLLRALEDRPDVPSQRIEKYANVKTYVKRKDTMLDQPSDGEKHDVGYLADWGPKSTSMASAWRAKDEAFLVDALAHWRDGKRAHDVTDDPDRFIVHLSFWESNELFDLDPGPGARWIRCATEPYNDDMRLDLARQRNWLQAFEVKHNVPAPGAKEEDLLPGKVHVSGHAGGNDIKRVVRAAAPTLLVPIHTEGKHLDLFADLGIDMWTSPQATFREAAQGRCVVEL